jgi:hypothetical protein
MNPRKSLPGQYFQIVHFFGAKQLDDVSRACCRRGHAGLFGFIGGNGRLIDKIGAFDKVPASVSL